VEVGKEVVLARRLELLRALVVAGLLEDVDWGAGGLRHPLSVASRRAL
jgi:hypothetical protein